MAEWEAPQLPISSLGSSGILEVPNHAWAGRSVEAAPAYGPKPPNAKNPASEEDGVF